MKKKRLIVAGIVVLVVAIIGFAVFSAATSRSKIADFADFPSQVSTVTISADGDSVQIDDAAAIDALMEMIQAVRVGPHANLGYYYDTPVTIVPDCEFFLISPEQESMNFALLKANHAGNTGSIRLTDRYGRLMEVYGTVDEAYFALLDYARDAVGS